MPESGSLALMSPSVFSAIMYVTASSPPTNGGEMCHDKDKQTQQVLAQEKTQHRTTQHKTTQQNTA